MKNRLAQVNKHFDKNQNDKSIIDAWSYLDMDEHLSERAKTMRNKCRAFAERFGPEMYDFTENASFPSHIIDEMAKLGIVGADLPEDIGGKGFNTVETGSFMFELAKKDASLATFYLLHHCAGIHSIHMMAQPELRKQILPPALSLQKIIANAITEPNFGSDANSIETQATKVQKGYLLNGQKRWIGNGTHADYIICQAKNTDDGSKIQAFLVRKGCPGLQVSKMQRKMSLRPIQNADMTLTDVFVPDNDKLQLAKDFSQGAQQMLAFSRIFVAWLATGIAAGTFEAAFRYTQKRMQFGKPIASRQLIQAQLVESMSTTKSKTTKFHMFVFMSTIQQSILLCVQISRLKDLQNSQLSTIGRIAMTKATCTENCRKVVRMARNVMGGTHEINTMIAGREMLGMSAFK